MERGGTLENARTTYKTHWVYRREDGTEIDIIEKIPESEQFEHMQVIGSKLGHLLLDDYWTPWCDLGGINIRAQVLPTRGSYNNWPVVMRQEEYEIHLRWTQFFRLIQAISQWFKEGVYNPDFRTFYKSEWEGCWIYADVIDQHRCLVTKGNVALVLEESVCKALATGCTLQCAGCANCRLTKFSETYLHIVQEDWNIS